MNKTDECACPNSKIEENSGETVDENSISTTSSIITKHSSTDICKKRKRRPNFQHELNCAKLALQQSSDISGENLYDHICMIVKRILDQRPQNVYDYFEEYSRNVREQKFNVINSFGKSFYVEPTFFEVAEDILASVKLPPQIEENDICEEGAEVECEVKPAPSINRIERKLMWNESVLLSQFYWSLCGFGFQFDEVFYLSWVIQKLQFHPTVDHCRFWGKIYGLKNNYFIAEVTFTQTEIARRNEKYKSELEFKSLRDPDSLKPITRPELIPGIKWQNRPKWELIKMRPKAAPVPLPDLEEEFNIPPEPFGSGVNRRSYFVINSLTDEWVELPLLDVKQINVARKIRKFFTGNLEALLFSYPRFPGCEKHYLRATIARIACSTFIAPDGFYRKETRRDRMGEDAEGEEEQDEEGEEDDTVNNDVVLLKNEKYIPMGMPEVGSLSNWVHVRPNILDIQGRVNFFNQAKAIKALLRRRRFEELGEEGELEEEDEEEGEEEEESIDIEAGPAIFTPSSEDSIPSSIPAWTARLSATHNKLNQVMVMRSNIWPGSYSFSVEQMADSIYLGWGHKYITRNFSPTHIPSIKKEYGNNDKLTEMLDPLPKELAQKSALFK